jgi:hypothetical protein
MNPEQDLKKILDSETTRIRESYGGQDVIFGIVELIRSLDYQTYILGHNFGLNDYELLEKYRYGWALPFSKLYDDLTLGDVPLFPSERESQEWADSVIQHGGSIQLCRQLLDYKKADLTQLSANGPNSFTFTHLFDHSAEYYEYVSLAFYHELMSKILDDKIQVLKDGLPAMRKSLQNIVQPMFDLFMTYGATDDIDRFYSRFGYLYLMTTQTIDEFDEHDKFGNHIYKDFLDVAEFVCMSAIMHRDCCMALAEKTSHKIYIRNILSYGFSLNRFIDSYSEYLGWGKEKLNEVFSAFILNKENYVYHLSYPKASPAPYFHIGNDIVMRSSFGSLDRPVFFLNRELKRKYPKDYFDAVNRREERFKKQLYSIFPQENIIKIEKSIDITIGTVSTDIDAVLYDQDTGTLGLFQLKWQDTFYTSMKERFSRITNLIPKSVEWLDKVENWLKANDEATILNTLRIDEKTGKKIGTIHLFVISRNHVHFTNQALDKRAVWASWYQVIESSTKNKSIRGTNPISELAVKLAFFSPEERKMAEEFKRLDNYKFKFANYEIAVNT